MTGTKFSNAEDYGRSFLRVALAALLIFPFLIWLIRISEWSFPAVGEWLPAVQVAAVQASLSTLLSLAVGFAMFRAAQGFNKPGFRRSVEIAMLLPNVVPPLFTVMGLLMLTSKLVGPFYGIGPVIVMHALINSGLVAVALDRLAQAKLTGLAETSFVLGAKPWKFWTRIAWPALRGDIASLALFVFSLCFTSFSIPLLLSGDRAVSLEVAIFDYIRMDGRWDKAVILAAMQSLFLLGIAWILPRPFWPPRPGRATLSLLAWRKVKSLVFLPWMVIAGGWLIGITTAMNVTLEPALWDAFLEAALSSLLLGFAVGFLHLVFFLSVVYVFPHRELSRFLNGYLAPSPVITGFGLILIPVEGELIDFAKLTLALTLISFPLLYRWMIHSALSGLEPQVQVARSLGAKWSQVLFEVVWPQIGPQVLRACGLSAVWGMGDFALSGILLNDAITLPLMIDDLLGHYRLDAAYLLLLPLLVLSVLIYGLFAGVSRYVHR